MTMFNDEKKFARRHIFLTSANHFVGGFGLAILLQHYLVGGAFLPVLIGWVLVAFMAAVHLYEFGR